jgi:membrane protease YdiL (CAAX protease family)
MTDPALTGKQRTMLVAPAVLVVSMYLAFQQFTATLGFPLGYLVAFALYWFAWCLALPIAIIGSRGVVGLLASGDSPFVRLGVRTHVLLWWPIVFPLVFVFLPHIATARPSMIVVSVALGIVIGLTEELLWRGVYVTLFADNIWLNTIYPSIAFAFWHLCPLSALPSRYPGGALSFMAYSIALGLSYAYYARKARSILWCTVSHCVHDSLGLGGFAYLSWLT